MTKGRLTSYILKLNILLSIPLPSQFFINLDISFVVWGVNSRKIFLYIDPKRIPFFFDIFSRFFLVSSFTFRLTVSFGNEVTRQMLEIVNFKLLFSSPIDPSNFCATSFLLSYNFSHSFSNSK